jgi:hypothetical protein
LVYEYIYLYLFLSKIPFVDRTADVILHSEIEARDVNVREVIEDFRGQVDSYTDIFEVVVLMVPGRYCVTFKRARKLEVAGNFGFTICGFPVTFKPVSLFKWVNITRLSYGVPDEDNNKDLFVPKNKIFTFFELYEKKYCYL